MLIDDDNPLVAINDIISSPSSSSSLHSDEERSLDAARSPIQTSSSSLMSHNDDDAEFYDEADSFLRFNDIQDITHLNMTNGNTTNGSSNKNLLILRARRERYKQMVQQLKSKSYLEQVVSIFNELLEECCEHICLNVIKQEKRRVLGRNLLSTTSPVINGSASTILKPKKRGRPKKSPDTQQQQQKNGIIEFGSEIFNRTLSDTQEISHVNCDHCDQPIASSRFAPHLERCMLRTQRKTRSNSSSSRNATTTTTTTKSKVYDDGINDDDYQDDDYIDKEDEDDDYKDEESEEEFVAPAPSPPPVQKKSSSSSLQKSKKRSSSQSEMEASNSKRSKSKKENNSPIVKSSPSKKNATPASSERSSKTSKQSAKTKTTTNTPPTSSGTSKKRKRESGKSSAGKQQKKIKEEPAAVLSPGGPSSSKMIPQPEPEPQVAPQQNELLTLDDESNRMFGELFTEDAPGNGSEFQDIFDFDTTFEFHSNSDPALLSDTDKEHAIAPFSDYY